MILRSMKLDDIPSVYEIEKKCFSTAWSEEAFTQEITHNDLANYFVAELDNEVVAYSGYWKILDEGHITVVSVNPDHRGMGFAKSLIEHMILDAKKQYINKMTLEVRKSNIAAINLYKNFDFYEVGIRPKYYIYDNEDAIIMFVELE